MLSRTNRVSAALAAVSFIAGIAALALSSAPLAALALALVAGTLLFLVIDSRRPDEEPFAPITVSRTGQAPQRREAPLSEPRQPGEAIPPPLTSQTAEPGATPSGVRPAVQGRVATEIAPPAPAPTDARTLGATAPAEVGPATPAEEQPPAAATPAEEPPSPTQPPPAPATLRFPATLECQSVLDILTESAARAGEVVSAHIWLEDQASSTLRLIDATGTLEPGFEVAELDERSMGVACTTRVATLESLSTLRRGDITLTQWRYSLPIGANGTRGVAAVDLLAERRPDGSLLVEATAPIRGALSGCLALHIARAQKKTADALLQMARTLSRLVAPDDVVDAALERAMDLAGASTGSVMLLGDDGRLRIAASHGLPDDVVAGTVVSEGEGIAGWVLVSGQSVLVEDLPERTRHIRRHGVRSAVSVPIADEDGTLGVLNVGSRSFPAGFTSSHLTALETLGSQVAVALRSARAVDTASSLYFDTLRAFAVAMETKDPYAGGATERVVDLSMAIGGEMGLSSDEERALEIAALLHDIGMSAAGDTVAVADRPLSTVERGLLKMHPVIAAEVLEQAPALKQVVPIVYHHHEWYDGRGYVAGVSGEAIPLGARILSVADAYVAMTSDRPYRAAMSQSEALDELTESSGTQFDPVVVEVASEVIRRSIPERAVKASRIHGA